MDNTLADYSGEILNEFRNKFPDKKYDRDNIWDLIHSDKNLHKEYRKIVCTPGFYANLTPIEFSIDAVKQLAKNYDIFFCSSPTVSNPTCHSDKAAWIDKYFGHKYAKKLILTKDKTVVYGDYLIDDKIIIKGINRNPFWKHIYYNQPYNKEFQDKDNVIKNWRDVSEIFRILR